MVSEQFRQMGEEILPECQVKANCDYVLVEPENLLEVYSELRKRQPDWFRQFGCARILALSFRTRAKKPRRVSHGEVRDFSKRFSLR